MENLPRPSATDGASDAGWRYIEPHPAQRDILAHPARYKVIVCGRRFGKTDLTIQQIGGAAVNAPEPYAYFSPTYKMLADVWRSFKHALRDVIAGKNETEKRIEVIGGGVIDFWSLDNPDAARGRKYAGIAVDEAAMVRDGQYIWPAVLRPLLTDYGGWALFPSTPRGHNWFWELYNMGNDPLYEDWATWQFPTVANPFIDPAEVEDARRLMPERLFRQEYLAEFIDDAGGVFRGVADVSTLSPQDGPQYGHEYVFGVDWGRHHDFSVVSVMDRTTRQQVDLDRFTGIGWELQYGRLRDMFDKWRPSVIWAEENSIGSPAVERLQRDGLPVRGFTTTSSTKGPLIESLALAIERRDVSLLNDRVQVAELQAYELERLPSGTFRYGAPDGGHDDTVIGLGLAWYGCSAPHTAVERVPHTGLWRGNGQRRKAGPRA